MEWPETIGPYRILEPLGQGGMGVVFRAEHGTTGERVALKTVQVPRESLLSSIRREIHTLARLRHPGIVRVLDEGVDAGLPWYAMEILDGRDLRAWAATRISPPASGRRRLSAETVAAVVTLARRICAPLAFLHGEGIVHRDLKPENILVLPGDRPVLVDFGLASIFGGHGSRDQLSTVDEVSGTIIYVSPEQVGGEQVDARADLYALGCILYELVAGRPPFVGNNFKVMMSHFREAPEPLSALADGVPPEVEALVAQLLAKRPVDRIGYADVLAARLGRLGGEPDETERVDGVRPRAYLYRSRFTGREGPLAELRRAMERLRASVGGVVLVGGESGLGKTRLVREAARAAEHAGVVALLGECPPPAARPAGAPGGVPLGPLRGPLRAIADRCREFGPFETDALLGPRGKLLAPYEPTLEGLPGQEAFPEPAELSPAVARERLYAALTETFLAFGRQLPVAVVLDDLQWADELTRGWLASLMRSGALDESRTLLVGTFRSEEIDDEFLREADPAGVLRIDLAPLERTAVAELVGDMLALAAAPAGLGEYLGRQSDGNPFFVAEYLRAAVEEELLWRDDSGRWRITETEGSLGGAVNFDRLPLPRSLRELVDRRLGGLPEDALALVDAAAVVGREATLDLVGRVAGFGETALMETVAELIRRHVVDEPEPGRLRFAHDQIREVAYAGLAPDRRSALHRAAAVALEPLAGADGDLAAALGGHWQQAGEPERARGWYLAGARAAYARFAHGEAERLYRAYLDLTDAPAPEAVEALNELGRDVLRMQGRAREAIETQERALDWARRIGDRAGEIRSLYEQGLVLKEVGELDRAEARFEEAMRVAADTGDLVAERKSRGYLAGVFYERGDLDRARELYTETLEAARETDDRRLEGQTLTNLAIVHVEQGRPDEAVELYERAVAVQNEIDDRNGLMIALNNYGFLHAEHGRFDEARAIYERGLEISREIGHRRFEGILLANMADLARDEGDPEAARDCCERALAIHRQVGNRRWEGMTIETLATVESDLGRADEARSLFEQALAIHEELDNRRHVARTLVLRAALERRAGGLDVARALLDRAEPALAGIGDLQSIAECECELAELAVARGEDAGPSLTRAREIATRLGIGPRSRLGRQLAGLEGRDSSTA